MKDACVFKIDNEMRASLDCVMKWKKKKKVPNSMVSMISFSIKQINARKIFFR